MSEIDEEKFQSRKKKMFFCLGMIETIWVFMLFYVLGCFEAGLTELFLQVLSRNKDEHGVTIIWGQSKILNNFVNKILNFKSKTLNLE